MNLRLSALVAASVAVSCAAMANDNIFIPPVTLEKNSDLGLMAHTNHLLYTGPWFRSSGSFDLGGAASHGPLFRMYATTPSGFFPADIRGAYGVTGIGGGAIAIVDAYGYRTALNDFNVFAQQFGLPQETSTNPTASTNKVLQLVYVGGAAPMAVGGWDQEQALDIEWAHAMAPKAKIYLVESPSSAYQALFQGVIKAASLSGVTQISMSWGGGEFSTESTFDRSLISSTATYFASAGDVGGAQEYPAESPKVVAVGGTSLTVNPNLSYGGETAWLGSGGGPSNFESTPSFQSGISPIVRGHRGGPDIAAVADPNTGVAVYDSTPYFGYYGWLVFGGTSVASPVCAGIANAAGANRGSGELNYIYSHTSGFHDITSGSAGTYSAGPGWDFVTGWGSPVSQGSL